MSAFNIKNRRLIIEHVSNLDNFYVGTVRGAWYPDVSTLDTGKLADHWTRELRASQGITYVVWSFGTPIAWRRAGTHWTVPGDRYSMTTSHHQSLVRQGITMREERINRAIAEVNGTR